MCVFFFLTFSFPRDKKTCHGGKIGHNWQVHPLNNYTQILHLYPFLIFQKKQINCYYYYYWWDWSLMFGELGALPPAVNWFVLRHDCCQKPPGRRVGESVKELHALSARISPHQHSEHTRCLPQSTSVSLSLTQIHPIRGERVWSDNHI